MTSENFPLSKAYSITIIIAILFLWAPLKPRSFPQLLQVFNRLLLVSIVTQTSLNTPRTDPLLEHPHCSYFKFLDQVPLYIIGRDPTYYGEYSNIQISIFASVLTVFILILIPWTLHLILQGEKLLEQKFQCKSKEEKPENSKIPKSQLQSALNSSRTDIITSNTEQILKSDTTSYSFSPRNIIDPLQEYFDQKQGQQEQQEIKQKVVEGKINDEEIESSSSSENEGPHHDKFRQIREMNAIECLLINTLKNQSSKILEKMENKGSKQYLVYKSNLINYPWRPSTNHLILQQLTLYLLISSIFCFKNNFKNLEFFPIFEQLLSLTVATFISIFSILMILFTFLSSKRDSNPETSQSHSTGNSPLIALSRLQIEQKILEKLDKDKLRRWPRNYYSLDLYPIQEIIEQEDGLGPSESNDSFVDPVTVQPINKTDTFTYKAGNSIQEEAIRLPVSRFIPSKENPTPIYSECTVESGDSFYQESSTPCKEKPHFYLYSNPSVNEETIEYKKKEKRPFKILDLIIFMKNHVFFLGREQEQINLNQIEDKNTQIFDTTQKISVVLFVYYVFIVGILVIISNNQNNNWLLPVVLVVEIAYEVLVSLLASGTMIINLRSAARGVDKIEFLEYVSWKIVSFLYLASFLIDQIFYVFLIIFSVLLLVDLLMHFIRKRKQKILKKKVLLIEEEERVKEREEQYKEEQKFKKMKKNRKKGLGAGQEIKKKNKFRAQYNGKQYRYKIPAYDVKNDLPKIPKMRMRRKSSDKIDTEDESSESRVMPLTR